MSGTHLNDLSKVYLDQVAKVKKAETEADIQRWEDLGGPTPENYKPLDDSAKIKTEGYEATKKKEVLAAFKRDPKVRKRFEKAAKKEGGPGSDKNRAADDMLQTAKDIAKKKGDTSKSDDRYAYESKLWDEVAENLTQLGELNDADFRVEGYQRNPERDTRSARQRRMDDPDTGINSQAFRDFMAAQQRPAKKKPVAKKDSK